MAADGLVGGLAVGATDGATELDGAADPDGAAEPDAAGDELGVTVSTGVGAGVGIGVRNPPWPPRSPYNRIPTKITTVAITK